MVSVLELLVMDPRSSWAYVSVMTLYGSSLFFCLKFSFLRHPPCLGSMGSLPEGTLCAYCGAREASYIPDGAAGPLCFEPRGECCYDRALALGWDVIIRERLMRLWKMRIAVLCKDRTALPTLGIGAIEFKVSSFIWQE